MESFAEKLRASAAQAAKAAQNLATKGLDEMAANDTYVQSAGFNAAAPRRDLRVGVSSSSSVHQQSEQHDDCSTLSTHSSAWQMDRRQLEAATRKSVEGRANQSQSSSHSLPGGVVPLKVNIPDRKSKIANLKQEDNASILTNDDDHDDGDSSNDDDDPIMSLIRQLPDRDGNGDDGSSTISERHILSGQKPKAHRFMEDLENRMAMPEQEFPPVSFAERPRKTANTASSVSDGPVLASWFSTSLPFPMTMEKNVRRKNADIDAPLARNKKGHVSQHHGDSLDDVAMVSSSAMFGDAEMRELAQFRQPQSTKCGSLQLAYMILQQHPRECFVVFTLLLGSFAYFYSRNPSLDV